MNKNVKSYLDALQGERWFPKKSGFESDMGLSLGDWEYVQKLRIRSCSVKEIRETT